ncbi:hypothetical protein ACFL4H_00345 [Candidatus Neomarinimicrobiota bacterium]
MTRTAYTKERKWNHAEYIDQSVKRGSSVQFKEINCSSYTHVERLTSGTEVNSDIFTGTGMALWKDHETNEYNGAIDNFYIRGTLWAYEFIIEQLRVHNGILIVGSGAKIKGVEVGGDHVDADYTLELEVEDGTSAHPFADDDLIMIKRIDIENANVIARIRMTVVDYQPAGGSQYCEVELKSGDDVPNEGMDVVRVGNLTDTDRQGGVMIVGDWINDDASPIAVKAPYIDIYDGCDSWDAWGYVFGELTSEGGNNAYTKVRVGKLDGLGSDYANQYGLYGSVVHLVGGSGSGYGVVSEGAGAPVAAGFPDGSVPDGSLYYDSTNAVYYRMVAGVWTLMAGGIDKNGELHLPVSPSGTGLFASGTHLGFYTAGAWKGYWLNDGVDNGDFYLKGASKTALWWDYSAGALKIGGTVAGDNYIETVAGTGAMNFYANSTNYMTAGYGIDGATGIGLNLSYGAFIYKNSNNGNAVSTLHSELYEQSSNYIGGVSSLVSTETSILTPSLPTNNLMAGFKGMAYSRDNTKAMAGVYGVGGGYSAGDAYGGYFVGDSGRNTYGVYTHADDGYDRAYGVYIKANAEDAWAYGIYINNVTNTVYGAAYGIYIGTLSSPDETYAIYSTTNAWSMFEGGFLFGSAEDTNLYRDGSNSLRTDGAFLAGGTLKTNASLYVDNDSASGSIFFGNTSSELKWNDALSPKRFVADTMFQSPIINTTTPYQLNGTPGIDVGGVTYDMVDIIDITIKGGIITGITTV